jgi:hypothetical protein
MAKAGDRNNTDWIWLSEARDIALKALGSMALAEKRLIEWLAAGELSWKSMDWQKLDPGSSSYFNGDSQFWHAYLKTTGRTMRRGSQ